MSAFKQFKNLIHDLVVWKLTWKVTKRNYHGWPVERMHRFTGRVQHKRYDVDGKWKAGTLPTLSHPYSLGKITGTYDEHRPSKSMH